MTSTNNSDMSSSPHQVLADNQHIIEMPLAQDNTLLSIIAIQAEQIKERDHLIMTMQSKIE